MFAKPIDEKRGFDKILKVWMGNSQDAHRAFMAYSKGHFIL